MIMKVCFEEIISEEYDGNKICCGHGMSEVIQQIRYQ